MLSNVVEIVLISIIITTTSIFGSGVTLTSEYSATYLTITCTVEDAKPTAFMIHLSCPVASGFCFSNCTAQCTLNSGSVCVPHKALSVISRCDYKTLSSSKVSTSYQINTSQVQKSGDWSCSFKNYKSSVLTLAKYETPTTITKAFEDTVPVPIKHVTIDERDSRNQIEAVTTTRRYISLYKTDQSTQSTKMNNLLDYMTRQEFVLVLILLLGISLLLNLSFLIRCVLLKSVIENYYRGIPNSQCILECLCLDLVSNKYMHRRYSRSLNQSNQVASNFYRCQPMCPDNMGIYDDLGAVSNSSARMKMKSNNSSEMDDESRLTNVLSNGGCHLNQMGMGSVSSSLTRRYTNPSHAAYFHPGLGNYVIVSGPVASHDQYSVGTAPPGYAIQMVSPIPSAPGSIGGGTGIVHSASSAHSDESDNDSRTALCTSMTSGIPYRSTRVNSQPIDLRDSGKLIEMSHNFIVPMNGTDQSIHYHHDNHNNFIRSNGSVPLHPWPKETIIPMASSISSLPYYTVSENGVCNQDLRNKNTNEKLPSPPKDVTQIEP